MRILPYLFCFLLVNCASQLVLASNTIKIAAGQSAGLYYKTAATICLILEKDLSRKCEVIVTSGSDENTFLLQKDSVDLALVQENLISGQIKKVHVMYSEYLFILYKGQPVKHLNEILLKKTSIDKNSGTYSILQETTDHLKIPFSPSSTTLNLKRNFDDFCFREAEVNFYSIGYPSDLIETTLLQCSNINIYSFSPEESNLIPNIKSISYLGKEISTVENKVYLTSKRDNPEIQKSIKKNFQLIKDMNNHIQ